MTISTTVRRLLAILFALALVAAACGDDDDGGDDTSGDDTTETGDGADDGDAGDDDDSDSGDGDADAGDGDDDGDAMVGDADETCTVGRAGEPAADLQPMTIVILPIVDIAPIQYAHDCGFFAANGLDVTLELAASGPAAGQLVASGEADLGITAWHPLSGAWLNGAPFVVGIDVAVIDPAQGNIMVAADSDIESLADLEGRTIAVNTTGALSEVALRAAFDDAGLDFSTLTMVEVPLPEMVAAVQSGSVDAMTALEPFTTIGQAEGLKVIATDLFGGRVAQGSTGGYVALADWANGNEELLRAARTANAQVVELFEADEAGFRAFLPTYTSLTPELAEVIALTDFYTTTEIANIQPSIDLTVELGMVPEAVDVSDLVAFPEG